MVKVKVISRNPNEYLRETKHDFHKVPRNYDPDLHHFEAAREYTRALNAVKLERVFAKPFVASLDGHTDGLSCLAKHPTQLSQLLSGAFDGELRLWDLSRRKCVRNFTAHEGVVRGITFTPNGENFISLSDDKTIKTWSSAIPGEGEEEQPINTVLSKSVLFGLSHHRRDPIFATCGEVCQIWNESRNEPIKTFQWGVDSLYDIAFNQVETSLLATCASDRSVILYDMRDAAPLRKVIMKLKVNKLCFHPMESYTFTCASEDFNLYTFDTRRLNKPVNIHQDHVAAVTHIDYSPTGREFVTGSYDKTIRIFESGKGHSRDVYHTKRMQRLTCVLWTLDDKYILSGSDEMNIRIWKARASEKLGPLKPRERQALQYAETLKEKFGSHPKIRRIKRHRQVPKHVYNALKEHRVIKNKDKKKESNRRTHSKPGTIQFVSERDKHVIQEEK
ncbi:DDB1- and CUL4-associated factor 13 [Harmonia axyridis]|uniref:DDB1- and CUL4-associated factor 13 n=1 Tax=Harmonia axyridis TaxID=115357 RepID=UPI001E276FBE|nr:DDB1- and CUL4-associated factor 13 [Harmonia axyridis]